MESAQEETARSFDALAVSARLAFQKAGVSPVGTRSRVANQHYKSMCVSWPCNVTGTSTFNIRIKSCWRKSESSASGPPVQHRSDHQGQPLPRCDGGRTFKSKGNDSRRAKIPTSCVSSTSHGSSDRHAAIGLSDSATILGSSLRRDSMMRKRMTIETGANLRELVPDPGLPSPGL